MVSQWIWRCQVPVFAIVGILGSAFGAMDTPPQGSDKPVVRPPLAGYDFSEEGRDVFGTHDLSLHGDAEIVYDLERGPVLRLGGTGYAQAEEAQLDLRNAMSLCYWIKEDANCPDRNLLVGQGWDITTEEYTFAVWRFDERKFEWRVSLWPPIPISATHKNHGIGAVDVSDGQWHHIAVTYDAEDVAAGRLIYVDGQLAHALRGAGPLDAPTTGITVGALPGGPPSYSPFVGWFDDVGFYDTSLTLAQVQQIMTQGLSGYNPAIPVYDYPSDGAELTHNSPTLAWQAGPNSVSCNVYLSQDREAVATLQPEAFLGQQTGSEIQLTGLNWATTYYWRVDAINEAHEDSPWIGPVWRFDTLGTHMIDDIESYGLVSPDLIYETWLDRWGYTVDGKPPYLGNGTRMTVGDYYYYYDEINDKEYEGHVGSTDIKYEGWFSLPLAYDNTELPYYSETQRIFEWPMDWTTNGNNAMAYLRMHYLGTVPPLSEFELSGGQYHVKGIWSDSFEDLDDLARLHKTDLSTFVSMPMHGNGSIRVKVESVEYTHEWARAGIMIRESLAVDARHVAALVTPSNRAEYLARRYVGGDNVSRDTGSPNSISVPHWLRLTRQDSTFTADHSADGESWEDLGVVYMVVPDEVQVGLMVNSFVDDKTLCHAVFSNLQVNGKSDVTLETLTNIGRPTNDPDHLYVSVRDARGQDAVIVHPDDPNALLVDQWQEWSLPLSEFQAQGVDLTQITQLAIGVGDTPRSGTSRDPGGRGKFYVDQIRLMAEE